MTVGKVQTVSASGRRSRDKKTRKPMGHSGDRWRGKGASASEPGRHSGHLTRRSLLATAAFLITTSGTHARVVTKVLPWDPNEAYPVVPVKPGGFLFFNAD